jgi:hypothetical protein
MPQIGATKPLQQTVLIAKLSIFIQFEASWAAAVQTYPFGSVLSERRFHVYEAPPDCCGIFSEEQQAHESRSLYPFRSA